MEGGDSGGGGDGCDGGEGGSIATTSGAVRLVGSGFCDGGVVAWRPPVTFFTVQGCEAHPYPDTTETTR